MKVGRIAAPLLPSSLEAACVALSGFCAPDSSGGPLPFDINVRQSGGGLSAVTPEPAVFCSVAAAAAQPPRTAFMLPSTHLTTDAIAEHAEQALMHDDYALFAACLEMLQPGPSTADPGSPQTP